MVTGSISTNLLLNNTGSNPLLETLITISDTSVATLHGGVGSTGVDTWSNISDHPDFQQVGSTTDSLAISSSGYVHFTLTPESTGTADITVQAKSVSPLVDCTPTGSTTITVGSGVTPYVPPTSLGGADITNRDIELVSLAIAMFLGYKFVQQFRWRL